MKNAPLVSIIIVNWNGGQIFKDCLKSLSQIDYPNWELILVDNASNDGSESYPKNYKLGAKRYELIRNEDNAGFAPANNQGINIAKGKYILLLNNDTKVAKDFLSIMVERMEKDAQVGAMQPKIYLMDKPTHLDNTGTFLTPTGFLEHWGYFQKDGSEYDQERYIFSAKGACLLTRKEIIDKVGLFDDSFVSYFEESDYCWRVWLLGSKVLYYPKTHIFHKVGFTSKRLSQIDINYYSLKNRITSFFKNLEPKNIILLLIPHLMIIFLLGVYYLIKLQFTKSKMCFTAIVWNLTHIPLLMKKRKEIQKIRKVSDKEVFKYTMHSVNLLHLFSHFLKVEANFKK